MKDLTWTDPWPATPPQAQAPRTTPANVNLPNRPYWLRDVGKGDLDFPRIFSALKDPRDHIYHVEHDDAGADETVDARRAAAAQPRRLREHVVDEPEVPRRARDPAPPLVGRTRAPARRRRAGAARLSPS